MNEEIKQEEMLPENAESPASLNPFEMAGECLVEVDKEDLLMEGLGDEIF